MKQWLRITVPRIARGQRRKKCVSHVVATEPLNIERLCAETYDGPEWLLASHIPDPERLAGAAEQRNLVMERGPTLMTEKQWAVVQAFLNGADPSEIAAGLQITPENVRVRLHNGLKALKSYAKKYVLIRAVH